MNDTVSNSLGKFLDPIAIIAQLNLSAGNTVVDFGCGPGYFSIPFAQAVGETGKVYSLDILPQALETVEGKVKNSGIANVFTKRVNLEKENGSKMETNSVDWVILKDILFQNQNKEAIVVEANRILKQGGKAIVVEWNQKDSGIGPEINLRVSQDALENIFCENKFSIEKKVNAGDFHYAFVAVKA